VPQQTGDDCGIYVLFFIYCFLQNEKLGEDFSQLVHHTFQRLYIFLHVPGSVTNFSFYLYDLVEGLYVQFRGTRQIPERH
jgi:hypothetical protein